MAGFYPKSDLHARSALNWQLRGKEWGWLQGGRGVSDPGERRRASAKEVEKQVDFERFKKIPSEINNLKK